MIANLRMTRKTDVAGQAREHVRHLIVSGALKHGDRLPSTAALAERWGIRAPSVHAALAALVKDGLLERQPGRGTFVSIGKPALTAVAIYTTADALANPVSSVQRVILAELQRQLTEDGIDAQVVVDPRHEEALAEPWEPLRQLSREHRVGATIAAAAIHYALPWLGRLPQVAAFVAFAGDEGIAGHVTMDFNQMSDLCLGALAEQGCRSVGLMCNMRMDTRLADGRTPPEAAFYGYFKAKARDLKLRVRDTWIMPRGAQAIEACRFHAYGYEAFRDLWRQKDRPDGLMIFPDSFVPGVLLAMAELGVRAPDHIKLAYHRNEQTPILNPYPATEAILSEREIAAALIAQARRVWKEEACETVWIKFKREDKE